MEVKAMTERIVIVAALLILFLAACSGPAAKTVLPPVLTPAFTPLETQAPAAPALAITAVEQDLPPTLPPEKMATPLQPPQGRISNVETPEPSNVVAGRIFPLDPAQPWSPKPGDKSLTRGQVFLEGMDLLVQESNPPQYTLSLEGSLPTPCHALRARILGADEKQRINVEVYSVADPNTICTQVLVPFNLQIPLGSLSGEKYTILVNGKEVGSSGK